MSKPIKRNENIVTLSREHHSGLLFCWKIRQGLKNNIEPGRIRQYINYFWHSHLQPHFYQEEAILFNKVNDKLCNEAIDQHQQIKALITKMSQSGMNDTDSLSSIAALVDMHIRFEERQLFPLIEASLAPEILNEIGPILQKMHEAITEDKYPDEFWIKQKSGT